MTPILLRWLSPRVLLSQTLALLVRVRYTSSMTEIKTVKSFLHKNISDDTVRYLTCHNQAHNFWFAKKQVVTDDKWRTCWTSSEYANQLGARNAIKYYLGV